VDMKLPIVATMAGPAEIDYAIATLVLAFGTDPVARWMYGNPHRYLLHIPRLFRALGTSSFDAGAAQRPLEVVIAESIAGERQAEVAAVFERTEHYRPTEPHWYLSLIASKLCIGTRGVVQHSCSTAFANAIGSTSPHIYGHRTH
jgi:hypothetical protein